MTCRNDPALPILVHTTMALGALFGPDDECPAKVGTTTNVRTFAGDGLPLAAWDAHVGSKNGCKEPFVWQRVRRRYRSSNFPSPTIAASPCDLIRVLELEMGVGWCAEMGDERGQVPWPKLEAEAVKAMDTAWRLEEALCMVSQLVKKDDAQQQVGTDTLVPYGPEGGVIAWSGILYVSY